MSEVLFEKYTNVLCCSLYDAHVLVITSRAFTTQRQCCSYRQCLVCGGALDGGVYMCKQSLWLQLGCGAWVWMESVAECGSQRVIIACVAYM